LYPTYKGREREGVEGREAGRKGGEKCRPPFRKFLDPPLVDDLVMTPGAAVLVKFS